MLPKSSGARLRRDALAVYSSGEGEELASRNGLPGYV